MYLNPAGIAIGRHYHVETLYGFVPTVPVHIAGGSVIDSVTAPVAMGIAFNYITVDPDGIDQTEYDVRLAAAYYIAQLVSIGLSVKYMYSDQDGAGMLGNHLFTYNGDELLNTVTVDVGATLTVGRIFSASVVGYNLTNTGSIAAPLTLGIGAAVAISSFSIVVDALFDFTTWEEMMVRAMGGAEYLIAGNWPLRVGYRYDQGFDSHSVTAGLGYMNEKFGLELSMRQDVAAENLHTSLALSIRYFAN